MGQMGRGVGRGGQGWLGPCGVAGRVRVWAGWVGMGRSVVTKACRRPWEKDKPKEQGQGHTPRTPSCVVRSFPSRMECACFRARACPPLSTLQCGAIISESRQPSVPLAAHGPPAARPVTPAVGAFCNGSQAVSRASLQYPNTGGAPDVSRAGRRYPRRLTGL